MNVNDICAKMNKSEHVKISIDNLKNNDLFIDDNNNIYCYIDNENYKCTIDICSLLPMFETEHKIKKSLKFNDLNQEAIEQKLGFKMNQIILKHGLIPKRITDCIYQMYSEEKETTHNEFRFYICIVNGKYEIIESSVIQTTGSSVLYDIDNDMNMIKRINANIVACCHCHTGFDAWFSRPDIVDAHAWPNNVIHLVFGEPEKKSPSEIMTEKKGFMFSDNYGTIKNNRPLLSVAVGVNPPNDELRELHNVHIFEDEATINIRSKRVRIIENYTIYNSIYEDDSIIKNLRGFYEDYNY